MIRLGAATIAALFFFAGLATAQADITLRARDGTFEISGRFLGYDGRFVRIESAAGAVTLDFDALTCIGADCPDPETWIETIRFAGTPRIGNVILPVLIEGYARSEGLGVSFLEGVDSRNGIEIFGPDEKKIVQITINPLGSTEGFSALLEGRADILMSTRPLTDQEAADANEAGLGDMSAASRIRVLAYDAVVPIVSPMSSIATLGFTDLARLFSGDVRDWSAVRGAAGPVALHIGDPDSGLAASFVDRVLGPTRRQLTDDATIHPDDESIVAAVLADPGAIGLVSFEATGSAIPLPLAGRCGMKSIATIETVQTGDYPLALPLYLYLPERRLGPFGRNFLAWSSSPEAQRILRRLGVPGQLAGRVPIRDQGDRLLSAVLAAEDDAGLLAVRQFAETIDGYDRLTPTFRFIPGGSELDGASEARLRVLARSIMEGRFAGQELMLLGFSDGRGDTQSNSELSRRRAVAVGDRLTELLGGDLPYGMNLSVDGYGDVSPLGCDDSLLGREINRRVELWAPAPDG